MLYYEKRDAQIQMAELVEQTLTNGGEALVEAGTGTGKSLAYLVPALNTDANDVVAISTGTKNLQEQLVKKDIPFLKTLWEEDFSYMLIQGRSNYLCLSKLYNTLINEDDRVFLKKWVEETRTGNLNEVIGKIDWDTRQMVGSDPDYCLGQRCSMYKECFTTLLRSQAKECKLLVVNHHLLLTDLMIKYTAGFEQGLILPPINHIILDEAHHLEDIASDCFGQEVTFNDFINIKNQTASSKELQRKDIALKNRIENELDEVTSYINRAKEIIRQKEKEQEDRIELNSELALVAGNIKSCFVEARNLLSEYDEDTLEAMALYRKTARVVSGLEAFLNEEQDSVSWANRKGFYNVPLKVAEQLNNVLFEPHHSVVLTSATLSTSGNFSYIKSRLGLETPEEAILPSPFDYSKVLLAIPNDLHRPNSDEYVKKIGEHLQEILPQIKGGSFVLCTSFKMVRALQDALRGKVNLYVQGEQSPQDLIRSFIEDGSGVLIGVDSFWEGVDVPGEALKAVFITKMPFPVPTEPLFEARRKLVEERGGNSFRELSLPIALLKLRQGFGRLIRRQSDEGLVVIYDSRILVKNYKRDVFNSLPNCSEWRGPLDELSEYIKSESCWCEKLFKKPNCASSIGRF